MKSLPPKERNGVNCLEIGSGNDDLLRTSSQITFIPGGTIPLPVIVNIQIFLMSKKAEFDMIGHLLRMIIDSGEDVKALIFRCSITTDQRIDNTTGKRINFRAIGLLKYISNTEEVHFIRVQPSVRTMEVVDCLPVYHLHVPN